MLTQQEIRQQLDTIADEVTRPSGLHYELFSRLYSQRVRRWIRSVPHSEAAKIEREIENDPDYVPDTSLLPDTGLLPDTSLSAGKRTTANDAVEIRLPPPKPTLLINPAWDMDY